MRTRLASAALLVLSGIPSAGATQPSFAVRDDRGVVVALPAPAQRIVTLSPHLAEIVHAAGAGAKLVGVARFSDYPETVRWLPQVGDAARIDPERVLALRPDLVLAWKSGNQAGDVDRLETLGLHVFVTEPAHLADVPRVMRAVGALAGTSAAADQAEKKFNNKINKIKFTGHGEPLRVFYEIWHRPLLTVNGRHMISDVLALCGGANVFASARPLTPAVSIEAVVAARPEAIVGGSSATPPLEFEAQWRRASVAALASLPVIHVPPDLIQRATPRIAEGAQVVCAGLAAIRRSRGTTAAFDR